MGIAINAMGGVGLGLLQLASDDNQLRSLTFWMMGSFGRSTWDAIIPAFAVMIPASYFLVRNVRALDLLQLGDGEARNLGIDVNRVRKSIVFWCGCSRWSGCGHRRYDRIRRPGDSTHSPIIGWSHSSICDPSFCTTWREYADCC